MALFSLKTFFRTCSVVALHCLLLAGLQAQADAPAPAMPIIKEINVQFVGASTLSKERVLESIATKVGQSFNDRMVDEDVKVLYATGQVSNARIFAEPMTGGLKVTVLLEGRPKIEEVLIEGSSAIPMNKIRKEIATKPGDAYSEERIADDRQKIIKLYEDKNYTKVKVDTSVSELKESKRMRVIFRIQEGPKLVVRNISFVGNLSILPKDITKVMKTKTANLLSFLTKDGRLVPAQMDEDEEAIRALYQNRGFADIKVTDVKTESDGDKGINLIITMVEGPQYRLHHLSIEGANVVTAAALEQELKMKSGSLYTPDGMGADLKKLRDAYGAKGYVDMNVQPQVTPVSDSQIDLTYHIDEGVQSYINLISVQGNTFTKDKVIRREMAVTPGALYDSTLVDLSKSRLMNLNYFSKVDMVPEDTLVPGRKDIKVIVEEKKTGSLNFGAGYSTVDSLIGFAELQQSNFDLFNWPDFTGGGQRFRTRVQYGIQRKDFEASLTEPWFMGYQLSLGGQFFYHEANYLSPVYNQSNLGAAIQLRKALTPLLAANLEYRPEQVRIFNVQTASVPSTSPIQTDANNSPYFKSAIMAGLNYDTRDSLFLTRKGEKVDFTFFGAGGGLGGNVQDYGLRLDGQKFFQLPWDCILQLKGSLAAVNSWGSGSKGTATPPIFDELYLGGANDMRGFFYRRVSPVDGNNNFIGGNSLGYGTAETTFPIFPRVRGAVFTDWGFVNPGSYAYDFSNMCGDVGIGVRLELPIGPVRIDWGYPVQCQSYNKSNGQFNFTVGYQF